MAIAAENPRIRSIAGSGRAFATDWWNSRRPQSLLYRPLTMASFTIDYAVARAGEDGPPPARLPAAAARPFHVQNVAWHTAASAALFFLVLELFASPGLALATAAFFAVHPVHTEAVDGIVGRAELMSACFSFLGLLAAWRVVRDDPPGLLRPALAGVAVFLALLSKEQAIVIPAVPLLWLLPLPARDRAALLARRSVRRLAAAFAAALVAYLLLRGAVLGSPFATGAAQGAGLSVDNPVATAAGAARILTPVRVFGHALRVLVSPRTLSADYSYDQIPIVASLDAATACCALALAGLLLAAYLLRRSSPAVAFGIGLFLISWALTSNIPIVIGTIFGERLLYMPSAGICLVAASGLIACERRLRVRGLATAVAVVLVAAGGVGTFARNRDWLDNKSLFASAAAASPRSCKALNGNASEWLTAGRPQDAIDWAQRSLTVYPSYAAAHQTLAKSQRAIANEERDPARKAELRAEAAGHAREAIAILGAGDRTALADAWNVVGGLALDAGNVDDALAGFRKSLEFDSDFVPAVTGLGAAMAERARGETDASAKQTGSEAALKQFERALALDPGNAEAQQDAAVTMRALADSAGDDRARADLLAQAGGYEARAMAAQREKGDAAALANLHGLSGTRLLGEHRLAEALAEFREAARLQPAAARGFVGAGTVLAAQAESESDAARKAALLDEAVRSFLDAIEVEPGNPDAHLNLGIITLRRRGDPNVVAQQFREYLRLVPDTPQRAQMEATIRQMDAAAATRR